MPDTIWPGRANTILVETSGQFTTTVKDTQSYSGEGYTALEGSEWDGTYTLSIDQGATNDIFRVSGHDPFSSTVDATISLSGSANPRAVSEDGSDTIWADAGNDVLNRLTGFTSTLNATVSVSGIDTDPRGVSWDGTDDELLMCGTFSDLLYAFTGFTSTQRATFDVSGDTSFPGGISWDGTNTLYAGLAPAIMYSRSGQFTSTLVDTMNPTSIDSNPGDIAHDDVDGRLGAAPAEEPPRLRTLLGAGI